MLYIHIHLRYTNWVLAADYPILKLLKTITLIVTNYVVVLRL
nr:MAG TPA: hypothetical protein [Caudoviricetes sp.]